MHVVTKAFWLPKSGNSVEEYEDAYHFNEGTIPEVGEFRCAVGDGAAQTIFSGAWARILVKEICGNGFATITNSLPDLQSAWLNSALEKTLPWYAERKVQMGACAALAALILRTPSPGNGQCGMWESLAVGDTCLFHVRRNKLLCHFPIANAQDFEKNPLLVSTNPENNGDLAQGIATVSGDWEIDDYFLLMTDAIACWFMRSVENGDEPWSILCDLATPGKTPPFEEWIGDLRNCRLIKNDDVTVLVVNIAG